jgi:N-acetylgalactosamine-N,N'-diacetylbacillosaminyl-diphospho-undecaprenol 4-alpha-N-acetylgalactosaminyltransferase
LIVFAGRFSGEKNLQNLLMVMGKILNVRPRAVALLFGEGPLKGELVDIHRKLNLGDRVRILNYSNNLWRVLKRANVFVSVSYFEGNPNTVLEAGACKCPLVLSDIPAHREIFDSASAWFVDPNSPDAISEGVLRVLEGPEEAEGRAELAYARISPHSVESMAREYCTLYRRMFNR